MIKYCFNIILLLLLINIEASAQSVINIGLKKNGYSVKRYTTENGLSNNEISRIVQDDYGFIWLATSDGLTRFDGNDFKVFKHVPYVKNSLPFFKIQSLILDESNQLWILSANKLYRFDRSQECFIEYSSRKQADLKSDTIYNIVNAPDKSLWIFGNKGISRFNPSLNSFSHYSVHCNSSLPLQNGIFWIDNYNKFWVYSKGFLFKGLIKKADTGEQLIYFYKKITLDLPIQSTSPLMLQSDIFQATDSSVFMAGTRGLYYLDMKKFMSRPASTEELRLRKFDNTRSIFWAIKGQGLFVYLPISEKLIHLDDDQVQNPSAVLYDKNGSLWFGGIDKMKNGTGLNQINQISTVFNSYLTDNSESQNFNVSTVFKDSKNNLWIGCNNSGFIYKQSAEGELRKIRQIHQEKKGNSNAAVSFLEDSENNIWIGYDEKFLDVFNLNSDKFSDGTILVPELNIKNDQRLSYKFLVKDKDGNFYAGGSNYLFHFNPILKKLLHVFDLKTLDINEINALCVAKNGNLWVGSSNVFFRFNADLKNPKQFLLSSTYYNIQCIIEEKNSDKLWLGLQGGGICNFEPKSRNSVFYTSSNGLAGNNAYHILQDNRQNLWISTNHGISCLNLNDKYFNNYSLSDGLRINEFNPNAGFITEKGEMIFGGDGGIAGFYPDSLELCNKNMSNNTKLLITNVSSPGNGNGGEIAIYETSLIRFPRKTTNFKITFSCIDFIFNDKINYRYRLKGVENEWVITDSRHRSANYSSMQPGSYLFEVESTDKSGKWINHAELTIKIPAWFYETLIFKLVIILLLALFISWFVNFRFRQMQHYERRKQEQLKLESLRGQMNPHFTFNSLNAVNYLIAINDKKRANEYISDLSRLMRSILTNSQNEFIPLELEINNIKDYLKLEHLRFSDKFNFNIEINEDYFLEGIMVAPFLVQPFAENAILHGLCTLNERKGTLNLRFEKKLNKCIVCYIEDDGIGRKKSETRKSDFEKSHQSRGTDLTIERLSIMNSLYKTNHKISITDLFSNKEESGTCVIIEIPYIYQ